MIHPVLFNLVLIRLERVPSKGNPIASKSSFNLVIGNTVIETAGSLIKSTFLSPRRVVDSLVNIFQPSLSLPGLQESIVS